MNRVLYSAAPWRPGDRLRRVKLAPYKTAGVGDLATYEGGAEYVPGLDAGLFTVKLDQPNEYGHIGEAYWDLASLQEDWVRIVEEN